MAYSYGTYGYLAQSVAEAAAEASTACLYVGTAPLGLVRGWAEKGAVNEPLVISSMAQARETIGMASDWGKYTLCEAVQAHFENPRGNVGPIYVINVLDPAAHAKAEAVTKSLTFANGSAAFSSEDIILDSFSLAGKAEGEDYALSYNFTTHKVVVASASRENPLAGTLLATYREMDASLVDEGDVVGEKTEGGTYTGLFAAELVYPRFNVIPTLFAAPGWSERPAVYRALCSMATKLNGHWDGFVYADLPVSYRTPVYEKVEDAGEKSPVQEGWYEREGSAYVPSEDAAAQEGKAYYQKKLETVAVDTITKAIAWKEANGYDSERSKAFWPQASGTDGNKYHLSSLAMAETMRLDASHDGVPMETCGNKAVAANRQHFGEGSGNAGYDVVAANGLCERGIDTLAFWGGSWKLWGDHTAAYAYGKEDLDPRDVFDVSMRMLFFLTNRFQRTWAGSVDKPFTVALKDTILAREQERLDALVVTGALIGNPRIEFVEANNSKADMRNGVFRWDVQVTPTPPLKSATAYVAYTDAGFDAYFG